MTALDQYVVEKLNPRSPRNANGGAGLAPARPTGNGQIGPALRERLTEWRRLRDEIRRGDQVASERQHAKGKLTARERLALLVDEGSYLEFDLYRRSVMAGSASRVGTHTDGVITGTGTVFGRTVFFYAQDFRVMGGSLGQAHAEKIHKVMDLAYETGSPLIALNDSGGARIQEGVTALAGYGGIFRRNVRASGVIPQISVILGPCAGGAAYSPALTDFVFMVRGSSYMFLTGPDVVKEVTGESVTQTALGGADVHAATSGTAAFAYDDERSCLADVRYLLSLLPANNCELPPTYAPDDPIDRESDLLLDLMPADPAKPYDMRAVIAEIVDEGEFFEVHQDWAQNVVCGFARFGGRVAGIVANQPLRVAGALDIRASEKAARFVRTCDAFNIALVTLVDVPGFMPGTDQEHNGIIRHGAKLLYAYCEATVPRVQVILRKAYGGAYIVMDSRSIGVDVSFAWPTNEIAVMGAASAVSVIHGKRLAAASEPERVRTELVDEYTREMLHPYYAAERGLVDDVIDPRQTRWYVARALESLWDKRAEGPARKHGNPPL